MLSKIFLSTMFFCSLAYAEDQILDHDEGFIYTINEEISIANDTDPFIIQCKEKKKAKKDSGKKKSNKNRSNKKRAAPKKKENKKVSAENKHRDLETEKERALIGESKNGIVVFREDPEANKEQIWDQKGNKLMEKEIEKAPEVQWEVVQV